MSKQFTVWENPIDRPANWSSFHNAELPKLYETEFQGIIPFEFSTTVAPEIPAAPAVTHAFQVTHVSGDTFHVRAGTCEGITIDAQDIDVGSSRPVAILAKPKYTLSVYNSEHVYSVVVQTGANAPVLETSTSTFGDVDTNIIGTQGRALIATIIDPNIIVQIAHGNIFGTFRDNGAFDGKMSGSYNKNA